MAVLGLAARHFGKNAGTGMCVHIPLRLNPIASLAWLGKQLPTPLVEESLKFYIYSDVSHTRPAAAGLSTEARAMR